MTKNLSKNFGSQNVWSTKILFQKFLGQKIILDPKNIGSKNILGLKKFKAQNFFFEISVQKTLGPKKFGLN